MQEMRLSDFNTAVMQECSGLEERIVLFGAALAEFEWSVNSSDQDLSWLRGRPREHRPKPVPKGSARRIARELQMRRTSSSRPSMIFREKAEEFFEREAAA